MKTPCEVITIKILPAVRGELVRRLIQEYYIKQLEVAALMGITQAAVSKYVASARGKDSQLLALFPEIGDFADKAAKELALLHGKSHQERRAGLQALQLCKICRKIQTNKNFKDYFKEISGMAKCTLCGQNL